jgi:hypothetical protein
MGLFTHYISQNLISFSPCIDIGCIKSENISKTKGETRFRSQWTLYSTADIVNKLFAKPNEEHFLINTVLYNFVITVFLRFKKISYINYFTMRCSSCVTVACRGTEALCFFYSSILVRMNNYEKKTLEVLINLPIWNFQNSLQSLYKGQAHQNYYSI